MSPAQNRGGEGNCNQTEYPASYGEFGRKLPGRKLPGPIIVSIDGEKLRTLNVCRERGGEQVGEEKQDDTEVFLAPGGVARFEINLRSPAGAVLDKDITEFLATGLVLSTNYGEVIPIFVSFEALQGKLEISHIPSIFESEHRDGIIQVPVGLFGSGTSNPAETHSSVNIPRNMSCSPCIREKRV